MILKCNDLSLKLSRDTNNNKTADSLDTKNLVFHYFRKNRDSSYGFRCVVRPCWLFKSSRRLRDADCCRLWTVDLQYCQITDGAAGDFLLTHFHRTVKKWFASFVYLVTPFLRYYCKLILKNPWHTSAKTESIGAPDRSGPTLAKARHGSRLSSVLKWLNWRWKKVHLIIADFWCNLWKSLRCSWVYEWNLIQFKWIRGCSDQNEFYV